MLESFTIDTFAARIGETFRFFTDASECTETQLIDVADMTVKAGPGAVGQPRAPFSILFIGPLEAFLPQGTYRVEHDDIGTFDLFIVPLGPRQDGMQYEANFT